MKVGDHVWFKNSVWQVTSAPLHLDKKYIKNLKTGEEDCIKESYARVIDYNHLPIGTRFYWGTSKSHWEIFGKVPNRNAYECKCLDGKWSKGEITPHDFTDDIHKNDLKITVIPEIYKPKLQDSEIWMASKKILQQRHPEAIVKILAIDINIKNCSYMVKHTLEATNGHKYMFVDEISELEIKDNISSYQKTYNRTGKWISFKDKCKHPNKYLNICSNTLKFWVCPDCKEEIK